METAVFEFHGLRQSFPIFGAVLLAIAGPANAEQGGDIPAGVMADLKDSYIFVFDGSVNALNAPGRANALVAAAGGTVRHVYSTALQGFSATMPADVAARLAAQNPEIAYYEADGVVRGKSVV